MADLVRSNSSGWTFFGEVPLSTMGRTVRKLAMVAVAL